MGSSIFSSSSFGLSSRILYIFFLSCVNFPSNFICTWISCKAKWSDIDIFSSILWIRGIRLSLDSTSLILFLFLQIFFQPVQPTCFRVLMTVHCISANFYIGENDFLLRGDTCHGLTSTRVSWPLGVTRNRSRAQRSYPIPVQRQHLSRDMDVLRANQEWLSFFSPRIATSKLRPIRSWG